MLELEMLPAREGDCLLLTYGHPDSPRRVLIDGGRTGTYTEIKKNFAQLPESQRNFELVVVTHVDRDHIEGILAMLEDRERPIQFRDLWFNGYRHLTLEAFGPKQGERLTSAILNQQLPWNRAFAGGSVETDKEFTPIELDGDLKLRILSPNREKLEALIPEWKRKCLEAGLIPGAPEVERSDLPPDVEAFGSFKIETAADEPFEKDTSKPNGTSIALLVEYEDKRLLLAGDAHADLLAESIKPLAQKAGGKLSLDAFKVSHHSSDGNTSRELLDLISCPTYLISTNGSIYSHPDKNALARMVKFGDREKQLVFNYKTTQTSFWENAVWQNRHGYTTRYPSEGQSGTIKLSFSE